MTWTASPAKHEATNAHGYKITWAENKYGTWYNGYAPSGRCVDAGYDKEVVKRMCEMHREKLTKDRAMYAAKKASKEIQE